MNSHPRILVVDDSRLARTAIADLLEKGGYRQPRLAASAEEAFSLLQIDRPGDYSPVDLVLLDVEMPGTDGIAACRRLKSSPRTKDVPVIMVTSHQDPENLAEAFAAGAMDYITKPPRELELLARVRSALALKAEMDRRKAREWELMTITQKLAQANRELMDKQRRLDLDLEAAAGIQRSLLPQSAPPCPTCQFAWEFLPSQKIGGDIFNLLALDADHLALYVLDVTGHGVPAAMVTVSVSQNLLPHAGVVWNPEQGAVEPAAVLNELDRQYPLERFEKTFTVVYLLLEPTSGRLLYSNAGHPWPRIFHADGRVSQLTAGGTVIGLGGVVPFDQEEVRLAPGDRLLLFTDGATEYPSRTGELFGEQRLEEVLQENRALPLADWLGQLKQAITRFGHGCTPPDDITLVAVEFLGAEA